MYAVATEVRRADDAKVRAAMCWSTPGSGRQSQPLAGPPSLRVLAPASRRQGGMSLHRNFVVPETGAGGVGRLDEMSNLAFASRLAIARFRLPRDPRTLIRPSLEKPTIGESFSNLTVVKPASIPCRRMAMAKWQDLSRPPRQFQQSPAESRPWGSRREDEDATGMYLPLLPWRSGQGNDRAGTKRGPDHRERSGSASPNEWRTLIIALQHGAATAA